MFEADLDLANRLADAAGDVIRPFFRQQFLSSEKTDGTPVTEADHAAELAMRAILKTEREYDAVVGEEHPDKHGNSGRIWVLDPIDGTYSFMAGRPIFGCLIALMTDGLPVLGVLDQCISGERWIGSAESPATLNGNIITTRNCEKLSDAVLASSGPQYFTEHEAQRLQALVERTGKKKVIWGGDSYNYGLLAAGHIDIVVESGLKLHDFAALVALVDSAGGVMCDWGGKSLRAGSKGDVIAVGDPSILDEALQFLA